MSNEIAKPVETGLVQTGPIEGFEGLTQEDFTTPRLKLVQRTSDEVGQNGIAPGDWFNEVTHDHYPGQEGVVVVPCKIDHYYVKWIPYDERSPGENGFRGIVEKSDPALKTAEAEARAKFGNMRYKNNMFTTDAETGEVCELQETYNLYALVVEEDGFTTPVMIPFKSVMTRGFRDMVGMLLGARRNLFQNKVRITTAKKDFPNGPSYIVKGVFEGGKSDAFIGEEDPLFEPAVSFFNQLKEGKGLTRDDGNVETPAQNTEAAEGDIPF